MRATSLTSCSHLITLLLLTLPLLSTCRIPSDPPPPKKPTSIQLRHELVKSTFPPRGKHGRGRTGSKDTSSFRELQLNLCNSGYAKCYRQGRAVTEAASLIYSHAPNVVTANEVCLDDVTLHLQPALGEAWPDDYTYSVFQPAIDKRTNAAYKCKNKDLYGDVVIGRVPKAKWLGFDAYGGKYTTQQPDSNEQRTFACAYATGDHFVCTTHLATTRSVALTQGNALMRDAVPYLKALSGAAGDTVVGGDLNLEYDKGGSLNVQKIVPNGFTRKGDAGVQHVIFSNDLGFVGTEKRGMSYSDHPWFLVKLKRS